MGPPVRELLLLLAGVLRDGAEVPRGACVGMAPRPAAGGTGVTCKEETCVAMECYPFNWYVIYGHLIANVVVGKERNSGRK